MVRLPAAAGPCIRNRDGDAGEALAITVGANGGSDERTGGGGAYPLCLDPPLHLWLPVLEAEVRTTRVVLVEHPTVAMVRRRFQVAGDRIHRWRRWW